MATNMFQNVKVTILGQENQPKGFMDQMDECFTLTWKQRLIGFGVCVGLGLLLTIVSLPFLWTLSVTRFAILYCFGSILSIISTCFLMGPVTQIKRMMESKRILATSVYVLSIIGTLVVAFTIGNPIIVLVFLIVQFAALIWYCMTWIPGGQTALKAMIFRSAT